jgi:peptide deformylase
LVYCFRLATIVPNETIEVTKMPDELKIIYYPDPRLRKISAPVTVFDDSLKQLAERMLQLMREHRGVGLAAPQVGVNIRLFVINPTGEPGDDRVYVNPVLTDPAGDEEGEEGCLSLPGINAKILRSRDLKMTAQDLDGRAFEEIASGYLARIWQHEMDHLNGTLIIDRMGPAAKLGAKRTLKELEEKYAAANPAPPPKSPKRSR